MMKTLTKKQREKIYRKIVRESTQNYSILIGTSLIRCTPNRFFENDRYIARKLYPEIYLFEPNEFMVCWFNSWSEAVIALLLSAEMCKTK